MMRILPLSAAFSVATLFLLSCFHDSANALEPNYICFMVNKSGRIVDLTGSVCGFKKSASKVPEVSANSNQAFVEEYDSSVMEVEEAEPDASEEIQAAQIEETSEGVDAINAGQPPHP